MYFVENFPPVATEVNVTFEVRAGFNYSSIYTLMATDANNDSITFTLDPASAEGVTLDTVTGIIAWYNVPDSTDLNISVSISDGKTSSLWTVRIELCKCQGVGTLANERIS